MCDFSPLWFFKLPLTCLFEQMYLLSLAFCVDRHSNRETGTAMYNCIAKLWKLTATTRVCWKIIWVAITRVPGTPGEYNPLIWLKGMTNQSCFQIMLAGQSSHFSQEILAWKLRLGFNFDICRHYNLVRYHYHSSVSKSYKYETWNGSPNIQAPVEKKVQPNLFILLQWWCWQKTFCLRSSNHPPSF